MTHVLQPEPLTVEAFAPFGDVVAGASALPGGGNVQAINAGTAKRYDDLAQVDTTDQGGRTMVSLCDAVVRVGPIEIDLVERHPLGSQLFMPLSGTTLLVVVAAGDPPFTAANLRAFISTDGSGVNYRKGTWHMPLCPLGGEARFLVVDRDGPGDNCEEFHFPDGERPLVEIRL